MYSIEIVNKEINYKLIGKRVNKFNYSLRDSLNSFDEELLILNEFIWWLRVSYRFSFLLIEYLISTILNYKLMNRKIIDFNSFDIQN